MKLQTTSELIKKQTVQQIFSQFVNEAGPATHEPTVDKIVKCIENRKFAGIYYEEEGNGKVLSGFRLIVPVCIGRGYKSKNHVTHNLEYYLRGYVIMESQKSSYKQLHKIRRKSVSRSHHVPYYRMFKLDRITMWDTFRFTVTKVPAPGYNPDDKMISEILQSIDL